MSDRDSAQPGFDPRFDPAFQPGYDPLIHRKQSVFSRAAPVVDTFGTPSQDDAQLVSGVRSGVVSATLPALGVDEQGSGIEGFAVEEQPPAEEPAHWWKRVNPYFLMLGAIGVLFIIAGFVLVDVAVDAMRNGFSGNTAEDSYGWQVFWNVSLGGAPILVGLGLASLMSIVVILAAQWRPSRPHQRRASDVTRRPLVAFFSRADATPAESWRTRQR